MVAGSIGAWLLLPPTGIHFPGFSTYDKASAATVGILLATVIFEPKRLIAFRLRWFDLPVLLWCLCPFCSSISNGLGPYDGLSTVFRQTTVWLFPYLVGRLYLTDLGGLRDLALGMVIGGVCLVPLCLFEVRMSPLLLPMVYGMGGYEGTRYGGWRPHVFFQSGLDLGLWMNAVTLVAIWLWRTGQLKLLWGLPAGAIAAMLLITTILCKSTGATLLLVLGLGSLWVCWRTKSRWAMWALLSLMPVYYALRITDTSSGHGAVEVTRFLFGPDRAGSLEFRLVNEDLFIAKALQRPIFGWGGWGRNFIYDASGTSLTVIDQLTMIAFSSYGFVGLVAFSAALLLPPVLFFRRFGVKQWGQADLAPAVAIAVILNLYLLDCMINGMLNVIYVIAAGGVLNVAGAGSRLRAIDHAEGGIRRWANSRGRPPDVPATQRPSAVQRGAGVEPDAWLRESRERLAVRYQSLGRDLKAGGQFAEAKAFWLHALDLWTELSAACPDHPVVDRRWYECANDLAWLLANAPDLAVRDAAHATALASRAAEADPNCATYLNTLGAAHYRAGNFNAAIGALGRAVELTEGGTAFDHIFLAMAHAKLGDRQQAERWLDHAALWMGRHSPDHVELTCLCDEARSILPDARDPAIAVLNGCRGQSSD
jgi:hypothetical protein